MGGQGASATCANPAALASTASGTGMTGASASDCKAPCQSCEICFVDCAEGQRCEVNNCKMTAQSFEDELYSTQTSNIAPMDHPDSAPASVGHSGPSFGTVFTVIALATIVVAVAGASWKRFRPAAQEYSPLEPQVVEAKYGA